MRNMKNVHGVVTVAVGEKPYGFYCVAREISRTLDIPLVELEGKLKYFRYLSLFLNRPDFVIAVGTLSPMKLITLSVASRRVIAYIAIEGPISVPSSLRLLANNTNRLLFVTASNYVKKELSSSGLKIFGVVPHGIDFHKVCSSNFKLNFLPNRFKVLTVISSLRPDKFVGIRYLFQAWSKLPRNVKVGSVLVLKTPSVDQGRRVFELAKSMDVKDVEYVILDNYFTDEEMFALYRSSDLYLHPTLADGFGLPVLESLVCGTPVVVMDAEPWNEIVNRDAGWFVRVIREVVMRVGYSQRRLKIPDMDDFSKKLVEAIKYCKENREVLRKKCVRHACFFDANKVYGRFKKLVNLP